MAASYLTRHEYGPLPVYAVRTARDPHLGRVHPRRHELVGYLNMYRAATCAWCRRSWVTATT